MKNYNLKMLEAKRDLDQRLQLERRTREDGKRYARDYFRINKEKIINKSLDSLISSMEDQYHCETYFETCYIMQNEKYFEQSDAYRDGFKEEMVKLVSQSICQLIPDFKDNLDVMINEHYDFVYTIHIIVILQF